MGNLLGSITSIVEARTKYVRKACANIWGQLTIMEAILVATRGLEGVKAL